MREKLIYGLIGYPVKHSLSKAMQESAFKHYGINAEYRLFEIKPEKLEGFLLDGNFLAEDIEGKSIYAKDIKGFNITIPHKVRAREILEKKFSFDKDSYKNQENLYYVKLSGAVNTVKRENDELKYFNTDSTGFLKSLECNLKFITEGKNALLIGCGGAGRAVIASLSWIQQKINKIFINDINDDAISSARNHFSKFPHLNNKLKFISSKQIPEYITNCHLLVNGSPIGMKEGDALVIDKSLLDKNKSHISVFDVVYNRETQLIKDAEDLGIPAIGGLNMLLYQGAAAFELWTGKKAPIDKMREALLKAMNFLPAHRGEVSLNDSDSPFEIAYP